MTTVYVTGLSGVGKSSALMHLAEQGFKVIDTDYGYTTVGKTKDGEEVMLDEEKMNQLLQEHGESHLFISGCYSNQSKFYKLVDYIVLLSADLDVMLQRVVERTTNDFGKNEQEREEIIASFTYVLPLLKDSSDLVIDTTNKDVDVVCEELKRLL
ncbi:RNase adapter RapZ [Bacillus alkalicellulosilyticus]|uniref:RNase adapter RapZ n=1 Tax=Alkalihalobacterium alkalicellulosilyticum TaxID=1912214 RepID=UPI0014830D12|nr:RNase adapter RapZ [Bacillus alkalicellulosilyticus]